MAIKSYSTTSDPGGQHLWRRKTTITEGTAVTEAEGGWKRVKEITHDKLFREPAHWGATCADCGSVITEGTPCGIAEHVDHEGEVIDILEFCLDCCSDVPLPETTIEIEREAPTVLSKIGSFMDAHRDDPRMRLPGGSF